MSEYLLDFIKEMEANGCAPENPNEIFVDGKDHYFQIKGDKKKSRGEYCIVPIKDGHIYGNFINHRNSDKGSYCSWKKSKSMSKEERENIQKVYEENAKARQEAVKVVHESVASDSLAIWEDSDVCFEHEYLTKKRIKSHGFRIYNNMLVIPCMDGNKIWLLQTILADGTKRFSTGGRKKGCYYKIGDKIVDNIVGIAEGVATAATVHEATETTVYAAFDANNIIEIIQKVKIENPGCDIWIFADNDQWTKNNSGEPYNTGVEKAKEAAAKVPAIVVYPPIPENDELKRTDWNDIHVTEGITKVREIINSYIRQNNESKAKASEIRDEEPEGGDENVTVIDGTSVKLPFKVLGYDGKIGYFFSNRSKQILDFNLTTLNLKSLIPLAPLADWLHIFGDDKLCELKAVDALTRKTYDAGVYDKNIRVRGTGAWIDAGRVVLHCGDMLYVDGKPTKIESMKSYYTYIASQRLLRPAPTGLTSHEAINLEKICEKITWENKLSGALLAGWIVTAPLCGILKWRPHLFITGEPDSGKSTVINKVIMPSIGAMALKVDGGTTAPAIRDMMGYNARPIIYDEAEKNSNGSIMQGILELARGSSDGKIIGKYGQKTVECRYSMCFSAVFPPVEKTTDESRIVFMKIRKNRSETAMDDYSKLTKMIDEVLTPEFSARLLTRTMNNMHTILENIEVFEKVIRKIIKGARASTQMATLVAGLYSLYSTKVVTEEEALEWALKKDWNYHTNIAELSDPLKIVRHIASSVIRFNQGTFGTVDCTIGELVAAVKSRAPDDVIKEKRLAIRKLSSYGIDVNVEKGLVVISANCNELKKLLKDTDFACNWHNMLMEVPNATEVNRHYFSQGLRGKGCAFPVGFFLAEDDGSGKD